MNKRRDFLRSLSGAAVATLVTGAGSTVPAWAQSTSGTTTKGSGSSTGSSGSSGSTGSTGTAGSGGAAGKTPKLSESDTQAVALGYKDDTTQVDQKKFPNHQATQVCSGCQFYQGPATAAMAPCTIFAGKQVAAKGWCSSYVKKAAG